jgi:hypothetical protein
VVEAAVVVAALQAACPRQRRQKKRFDNWAPAMRYRRKSLTSVIQWREASLTTDSMGSRFPGWLPPLSACVGHAARGRRCVTTGAVVFPAAMEIIHASYWKTTSCGATTEMVNERYRFAITMINATRIVSALGVALAGSSVIGAVTAYNVGNGALTVPIPKVPTPTRP